MYYRIYNLLCTLLLVAGAPFFLLYGFFTGKHLASLRERFGFFAFTNEREGLNIRLWLHAASVGEVQVAKSLIAEIALLLPEASFILSTVTEQGRFVAQQQLGEKVLCVYAPVDLVWVVNRFIQALKPTVYICLETELWPNMLKTAARKGVKLILLNGRMSENSYKNYCRVPIFAKEVLNYFTVISCITDEDRRRFEKLLGAGEKVRVNGNAKYANVQNDFAELPNDRNSKEKSDTILNSETARYYKEKLSVGPSDIVCIAGSTHEGEEQQLITMYKKVIMSRPSFVMMVAPRHISRISKIEALLKENDLEYQLYSSFAGESRHKSFILIDTIGELANLYSVATFVFCGGSLVPKGGHNIMEAASWGKPVFFGPSMDDFQDARYLLENAGAGFLVSNSNELCEKILYFHNNQDEYLKASEKALEVTARQNGSARRQAAIIKDIVQ